MTFTKNIFNLLYKIIYIIEVSWLLIDSIGGYFLNQNAGQTTVNTVIRSIVLTIISLVFLFDKRIKYRLLPLLLVFLLLTLSIIQMLYFKLSEVDLSILFRLVLLPIFIILIRAQINLGKIEYKHVKIIITVNSLIILGNIILSFFNIGASQYGINKSGEFIGGTGFFYAGNDVGGTILILSALGLFIYSKKGFLPLLVFSVIYLVCALGLLSKTALASVAFNIVLIFLLNYGYKSIFFFLGLLPVSLFFIDAIMNQINLFWTRTSYFGESYGWNTLLMGGTKRHNAIGDFFSFLIQEPLIFFIGHGWSGKTENNFFDVFEAFGIFGYLLFFIPVGYYFYTQNKLRIKYKNKLLIKFACCLIFIVSIVAGHTLQSTMLAPFLAILLNIGYLEFKEKMQAENTGNPSIFTHLRRNSFVYEKQ
jgi:hypothetical protein